MSAPAGRSGERPRDSGLYVYGILRSADAGEEVRADAPPGVASSAAVALVRAGSLAAIVSEVSLADFEEEVLAERARDPQWLEESVRAHETVLDAFLPAPIVPFRFGAIFRDAEHVRRTLQEGERFERLLDRLDGTVELGVKGFLDAGRAAGAAEPPAAAEDAAAGRSYLLRKQLERRLAEEREAARASLAAESHEVLAAGSRDARANALRSAGGAGRGGEMFLNGAYLVEAEREGEFRAALAGLEARHAAAGATYELTGPWPPYNFVEDEDGT